MKIELKQSSGRWLINNKTYALCSEKEKKFFDEFIKEIKNSKDN